MKKIISLIMSFIMLAGISAGAVSEPFSETKNYIYQTVKNPAVSSIGGEWAVFGLLRGEAQAESEYYEKYYKNLENKLKENSGVLHEKKYTEYSRVILALTAMGKNPENVFGYNLLSPLADYEKTVSQGINGAVWALIAINCGNYIVSENAGVKEQYINKILSEQNPDGGWSMGGSDVSDTDMTAMALCALAGCEKTEKTEASIDEGIAFLSAAQNEGGLFQSSESVSQCIIALCELGIPLSDTRFVKNGKSLSDELMTFYEGNGQFKHLKEDEEANLMATEQALCALSAIWRFETGKTSLYDMSDVSKKADSEKIYEGLSGKHPDVKKMNFVGKKSFSDITESYAKEKIEALAAVGIISGKSETEFVPKATMTRAEFATIITRGLGLTKKSDKKFSDVSENDWYFGFISSAYNYGIVSGVSENEFNPNGVITREEAAVMIGRGARLCGLDTFVAVPRDVLSEFEDYITVSDWAMSDMAFCVGNDIISKDEINLLPKENVTREEIAAMLYVMLSEAELLEDK